MTSHFSTLLLHYLQKCYKRILKGRRTNKFLWKFQSDITRTNLCSHIYIHTLFTSSHYYTWRRIMRLSLYNIKIPLLNNLYPAQERLATTPASTSPALSEQQCRFFYIPQELYIKWNCCEKTRKFSLQISFKGSIFSSVILRWVMVQLGFEPVVSHSADGRSPKWANYVVYLAGRCNWRDYHVP